MERHKGHFPGVTTLLEPILLSRSYSTAPANVNCVAFSPARDWVTSPSLHLSSRNQYVARKRPYHFYDHFGSRPKFGSDSLYQSELNVSGGGISTQLSHALSTLATGDAHSGRQLHEFGGRVQHQYRSSEQDQHQHRIRTSFSVGSRFVRVVVFRDARARVVRQ